jgi:hypothetical protein
MAEVLKFPSFSKRLHPALTPAERDFAEHLLKIWPNYRYDRSGLPKLTRSRLRALRPPLRPPRP